MMCKNGSVLKDIKLRFILMDSFFYYSKFIGINELLRKLVQFELKYIVIYDQYFYCFDVCIFINVFCV